jgi:hypothetical protein
MLTHRGIKIAMYALLTQYVYIFRLIIMLGLERNKYIEQVTPVGLLLNG